MNSCSVSLPFFLVSEKLASFLLTIMNVRDKTSSVHTLAHHLYAFVFHSPLIKNNVNGWCWSWKCLCSIDDTSIFLLSSASQSFRQTTSSATPAITDGSFVGGFISHKLFNACVCYTWKCWWCCWWKGEKCVLFSPNVLFLFFLGSFSILTRSSPRDCMCVHLPMVWMFFYQYA